MSAVHKEEKQDSLQYRAVSHHSSSLTWAPPPSLCLWLQQQQQQWWQQQNNINNTKVTQSGSQRPQLQWRQARKRFCARFFFFGGLRVFLMQMARACSPGKEVGHYQNGCSWRCLPPLIEYVAHVIELRTRNPVCYLHNILKDVPLFDTKVTTPVYDWKQNKVKAVYNSDTRVLSIWKEASSLRQKSCCRPLLRSVSVTTTFCDFLTTNLSMMESWCLRLELGLGSLLMSLRGLSRTVLQASLPPETSSSVTRTWLPSSFTGAVTPGLTRDADPYQGGFSSLAQSLRTYVTTAVALMQTRCEHDPKGNMQSDCEQILSWTCLYRDQEATLWSLVPSIEDLVLCDSRLSNFLKR